jgi:hypothetical protein
MAIRRQGYLFEFKDIGNLPIIRIDELSTRQQSIMVGLDIDDGFGVLTKSLYTPADQFIVLEYVGSTPGGFKASELKGAKWGPRGFVNILLDDTGYFQTLDGRDYDGISGIGAPFPVSLNYQPAYKTFIPIEIPPGTWYDVRYIAYNRVVEIETQFTACTTPTDVAGVGDMITFLDYVKP